MPALEAEQIPLFKRSALAARYLARFDAATLTKEIYPTKARQAVDFTSVARRIPAYAIHRET